MGREAVVLGEFEAGCFQGVADVFAQLTQRRAIERGMRSRPARHW